MNYSACPWGLWGFPGGSDCKASACNVGTRVRFLGWEDPLEKEMAIHSSTLAWKIPWMEEPDRLQSMWSQRVRHNWATSLTLSLLRAINLSSGKWLTSLKTLVLISMYELQTYFLLYGSLLLMISFAIEFFFNFYIIMLDYHGVGKESDTTERLNWTELNQSPTRIYCAFFFDTWLDYTFLFPCS